MSSLTTTYTREDPNEANQHTATWTAVVKITGKGYGSKEEAEHFTAPYEDLAEALDTAPLQARLAMDDGDADTQSLTAGRA